MRQAAIKCLSGASSTEDINFRSVPDVQVLYLVKYWEE